MRNAISVARRHLAQRPSGDITEATRRYWMKNWGTATAK
jgi:hypothetical protein